MLLCLGQEAPYPPSTTPNKALRPSHIILSHVHTSLSHEGQRISMDYGEGGISCGMHYPNTRTYNTVRHWSDSVKAVTLVSITAQVLLW